VRTRKKKRNFGLEARRDLCSSTSRGKRSGEITTAHSIFEIPKLYERGEILYKVGAKRQKGAEPSGRANKAKATKRRQKEALLSLKKPFKT